MAHGPELYNESERSAFDALGRGTGEVLIQIGHLTVSSPYWPMDGSGSNGGAGANAILETIYAVERYLHVLRRVLAIEQGKTHHRFPMPPIP